MVSSESDPKQSSEIEVEKHPFNVAGPFYRKEVVLDWLGVDDKSLAALRTAHEVIAGVTQEGDHMFPAWQFEDNASIKEWVGKIVPVLAQGIENHWAFALWLSAPVEYLGGKSAVQWLDDGGDIEVVLAEARHDAARWSH